MCKLFRALLPWAPGLLFALAAVSPAFAGPVLSAQQTEGPIFVNTLRAYGGTRGIAGVFNGGRYVGSIFGTRSLGNGLIGLTLDSDDFAGSDTNLDSQVVEGSSGSFPTCTGSENLISIPASMAGKTGPGLPASACKLLIINVSSTILPVFSVVRALLSATANTGCIAETANCSPASRPRVFALLGLALFALVPAAGELWRTVTR